MTKVLVIDDQRIAREYMENVVKNGGDYELVGSLSKADLAETVCRRRKVDLVLMDVCTRGTKDGIDAAAELRRLFPELKMIVVILYGGGELYQAGQRGRGGQFLVQRNQPGGSAYRHGCHHAGQTDVAL